MKICNLGSGSRGNVTYIESDEAKILVDCGLTAREIELRLFAIGVNADDIDAIFVTHEHNDHINGLKQFVKKHKCDVFMHYLNLEAVLERQSFERVRANCFKLEDFLFKDILVCPFELSHDSVYCVGYAFCSNGQKVSIATDTGYMPNDAIDKMMYSDVVYIESNHNELLLLKNESYTAYLKKRILSSRGHLSNVDCAEVICKLAKGGTYQFVLSHLSEKNNTPCIAFDEVVSRLEKAGIVEGRDIYIDIASQDKVGTMFTINPRKETCDLESA